MTTQFDKLVEIVKREIQTGDPTQMEREYLASETIPDYIPQWAMFRGAEMYATNDILRGNGRATTIKINFENKAIHLWVLNAGQIGDETYRHTISIGEVCMYPSSGKLEHSRICGDLYREADKKLREYEEVRKKEDAIKQFIEQHPRKR